MWIAGGLAYGIGRKSTIDGEEKDDRKQNFLFAVSAGYSVTRNFGVKVGYLGKRALADTGADFDSFIVGASFFWSE
jgi:opacity protein-like surface antigen